MSTASAPSWRDSCSMFSGRFFPDGDVAAISVGNDSLQIVSGGYTLENIIAAPARVCWC